jgi:hypothetical protein
MDPYILPAKWPGKWLGKSIECNLEAARLQGPTVVSLVLRISKASVKGLLKCHIRLLTKPYMI